METIDIEKNIYPIGRYKKPELVTPEMQESYIQSIASLPARLRKTTETMSEEMLNLSYREGGWTARQIVHHIADSHINMYCRIKLALTEDNPTIRPYSQNYWAELDDGKNADIEVSLSIIESLHRRIVIMLKAMDAEQFNRTFYHPEYDRTTSLKEVAANYAWHGDHHLAQIENVINRIPLDPENQGNPTIIQIKAKNLSQ